MGGRFATTQWSIVLAARHGTEGEARRALETLCQAYWYPLYAYVRRRGHSADEAREHLDSEFLQLAVDAWRSPESIRVAHLAN